MKNVLYVLGIITLLYVLKVPQVVDLVTNIHQHVSIVWNYTIDVLINFRERHPYFYICIPFCILYLMKSHAES